MKKINLYLIVSVLLNILFFELLVYIVFYKTDLYKRVASQFGYFVATPSRQDDVCILAWTNTLRKLNLKVDVVFFGNSITCDGNFQEYFPQKIICNLGYPGEDIKGMIRRVEQIAVVHPSQVFVMSGINGLKEQSLDDFKIQYEFLVDKIIQQVPSAEIYIQSILPISKSSNYCDNFKIIQANEIIKIIALERHLIYIDLYKLYAVDQFLPDNLTTDGVHLRLAAYEVWANRVRSYIENPSKRGVPIQ